MRRPTGNQTAVGTTLASIGLLAAQHFFAVAPERDRANANMGSNFDCSAALTKEQNLTKEWRERWFGHQDEEH